MYFDGILLDWILKSINQKIKEKNNIQLPKKIKLDEIIEIIKQNLTKIVIPMLH